MFRLSNCVFSILNMLMMIFGIAAIISSLYLRLRTGATECQMALQSPLLILGIFLFVLSLLGLIGSFFRLTPVLWIYSLVTFVLVVGILAFSIFAYVVTNKGVGKAMSVFGYKEYRLGDYSNWLRKNFAHGKNWEKTKSCLIDVHICNTLRDDVNQKVEEFYKKKLSPIQSGCCKPPIYCGFEFKNATFWMVPKSGPATRDGGDCTTWSNDQETLCYDCSSCKGGVLEKMKKDWKILGIINGCVFGYIIIIYTTSCCTRKNIHISHRKYSNSFDKGYHP